jgi:phage protein D
MLRTFISANVTPLILVCLRTSHHTDCELTLLTTVPKTETDKQEWQKIPEDDEEHAATSVEYEEATGSGEATTPVEATMALWEEKLLAKAKAKLREKEKARAKVELAKAEAKVARALAKARMGVSGKGNGKAKGRGKGNGKGNGKMKGVGKGKAKATESELELEWELPNRESDEEDEDMDIFLSDDKLYGGTGEEDMGDQESDGENSEEE